jgi:hypothetical protein
MDLHFYLDVETLYLVRMRPGRIAVLALHLSSKGIIRPSRDRY